MKQPFKKFFKHPFIYPHLRFFKKVKKFLQKRRAFTLFELLMVIAIIGLLAVISISNIREIKEKTYFVRAQHELRSIHAALGLYRKDHGHYPPDSSRSVPPGLEEYLGVEEWPEGVWPGSVFDWENWIDPETNKPIYQISIRFCPIGQPEECMFPSQSWATNFDINSSVYYCIEGACRSHLSEPIDHPGHCINCN